MAVVKSVVTQSASFLVGLGFVGGLVVDAIWGLPL